MKDILTEKSFVYIIGSPKSGTTWLQIMLASHPLIVTTVELRLFSNYLKEWIKIWDIEYGNIKEGRWTQGLPFIWKEDEFYDFLKLFLTRVYEAVLKKKPDAFVILDKHPTNSLCIDIIKKLMPRAKFIHLIRDGRDVAVSMTMAKKNIGYGQNTISKAAEEWKLFVEKSRSAMQYKDDYIEIRYENLLNRDICVLQDAFRFCGINITETEAEQIYSEHEFIKMKKKRQHADNDAQTHEAFYRKGESGSWKEDMSSSDRYLFEKEAGKLLLELGYAESGWWAENFVTRLLIISSVLFKQALAKD